MTRKEAREEVFCLLFETEFQGEKSPEEIFALSEENREITEDDYIRETYFGVCSHREALDDVITKHSNGWKVSRITPVSRCAIRLCIYELMYRLDIPSAVSINEAVELIKKYDDAKMRAFANGLLNSAKNEIEAARAE